MLRDDDGTPRNDAPAADTCTVAERLGAGARESFADAPAIVRALAPDEPHFCLCEPDLERVCTAFINGFPGIVTYAVKANPALRVIETVRRAGIGAFDVASPHEMETVRAMAPDATLHYHNPIKSRTEVETAWKRHGVRHFSIDDRAGLDTVSAVAGADPRAEIAVRFRLPVSRAAHDFSTKFGADADGAATLLALAAERGYRPALTFHPGSQCLDPRGYVEHIIAAAAIARRAGVSLHTLNVGGGFPVAYPGTSLPPLGAFFEAIRSAAAEAFERQAPRLVAEPGRALVSTSTSVLTRVKHVRTDAGELYLNDGIYGAFMELTQYAVTLPMRVIPDGGRSLGHAMADFTVFGPTCDPIDRLPGTLALPAAIRTGDWIEFGMVGAYGAATVTRFNGYGTTRTINVDAVVGE